VDILENFKLSVPVILLMIAGLVELAKRFGVEGRPSLLLSWGLGVVFGGLFLLQGMYPEISIWVNLVVYCLTFGLVASGLYDLAQRFLPQAARSAPAGTTERLGGCVFEVEPPAEVQ
jgi:hypothetical protein